MLVNPVTTIFRVLTWCCVIALAVLSLLPAQELVDLSLLPALEMVRTRLPPQLEHFLAYAGAAAIGMAGYGPSRGSMRIIGGLWICAGLLEYLRHFSPGRHPSIEDFAASALGALCGGLAVAFLWRRRFDQPR
jgi:VanZ family protein